MTAQAELIRDKRRHVARPGGGHDRLIRVLLFALPIAIGVVAALMVLAPLAPRSEISFLLDRNKVALTDNRMAVERAMYRGADDKGRPFSINAGEAVQRTEAIREVELDSLIARILLNEGPAQLTASRGLYDFGDERIDVGGVVNFTAADGYRLMARNVSIDLASQSLVGEGRIEGKIPSGRFSADRLEVDLQDRTVSLIGDARLRMVPGELRLPQ
ncbi:LPS export ABC transporter periplasmic protein LptC [uncultured Croceicoccus sp.]|uniref:LPS export ABC transporter periplasmic protein LptC n=1 Tax=uncultured Croceicoccus sp. TaxID=1295329 RepID=UPI002605DD8D|nr:LPS export ABC transporter periplasmic protein LptC [uncultured Croceicoccus sp.]